MLKECKKHGLTDHAYNKPDKYGNRRYRCRKCAVESVVKRRRKIKKMSVEYKGGKCVKCGYCKCIDALEFHHKDPTKKDFGIAKKGFTRSWEKVKEELDKCDLVCSNCHKEIHSELKL
jgi:hypothetical protein